ncbi:hypothetical protein [Marinobacter sp.]|uniref:hypothetical protein n=1 Tax=Marinobacter sp. TaxID=50741 RepID=UPI0019F252B8|nr:hypothetical protein [Marinobacter sp.]MBE0487428.1 hypothetical protein [Marinobacter sp.]
MQTLSDQPDVIDLGRWHIPDLELERQGWEPPPRDTWRVERRLRQTRPGTSTLYTRFNQHYLLLKSHRRKRELPEQVIDLTFVQAQPREVRCYQARLWLAASVLVGLAILAGYGWPVSKLWMLPPMGVALGCAFLAWRNYQHRFEFLALNSDVVVFALEASLPDRQRASQFREEIAQSIQCAGARLPEGRARLPLAIAEMRRLAEIGVISTQDYEQIKRNWFALSFEQTSE